MIQSNILNVFKALTLEIILVLSLNLDFSFLLFWVSTFPHVVTVHSCVFVLESKKRKFDCVVLWYTVILVVFLLAMKHYWVSPVLFNCLAASLLPPVSMAVLPPRIVTTETWQASPRVCLRGFARKDFQRKCKQEAKECWLFSLWKNVFDQVRTRRPHGHLKDAWHKLDNVNPPL